MTDKILIVDDEPDNLDVLNNCLDNAGFEVIIANSGKMALRQLSHIRPDLILLDVRMPGMDGFETCHRLKATDAAKSVPVIFVTADTEVTDKVRGLEMGAADYITKPFHPEEVVARISKHLTLQRLQNELREKNAQLKQAEESYKSLFEAIPDDAFVLDWDWRYVVLNRSSWKRTTFTEDDIIGKKITDVYPQITDSQFWPAYQRAMEERIPSIKESEFRFETGEKGWYELRIFPVPDGILVISRDITERRLATDALKESEQNLKNAQALARLGFWKLDIETMNVTGSDELFNIFGISRDKATLESFTEIVHPDDREYDVSHIRRGMEHGMPWDIEHRLILRDGTQKWVHAIGEAIQDENGKILSLTCITQDTTERKQSQENLKEAKEAAEAANRAKSAFLANMSHELRSPLNAILGFTRVLDRSPAIPPEDKKHLAIIHRSGEHLLNLINDVLDMSKIEAERTVLCVEDFDMYHLLDNVEAMF
ncbi:MAG: response regulator, partial [Proteobacteria bacterium]|nr:response regulator [Pseudomonadota bacterium]